MKIIISPAKKMINDCAYITEMSIPVFIEKTKKLQTYLASLSYVELKKLLVCNEDIAKLNYQRYQNMDLSYNVTPALLSYDGIQYKYMAPDVFEEDYFTYVNQHLRILSGFYGILKPMDGVVPYRLEMQAKLKTDFCKNVYDYWKDELYKELTKEDSIILNLASDEYSKAILKYCTNENRVIQCTFGELINDKVKEKGVYVKMARGEMVRYMAENNIQNIEEIKNFNRLGFTYNEMLSNENHYVFIMKGEQ